MDFMNSEKSAIIRFFLRLLPAHLLADLAERNASIVLLAILLVNTFISIISFPLFYFVFDQSPAVFQFGAPILAACIFFYGIAYLKLVYHGNRIFAGNIILFVFYAAPTIAVWLTKGIQSSLLFLLFMPPVFAFLLTNFISGIFWFLLTIISFILFWVLQYNFGFAPLDLVPETIQVGLLNVIIPIMACIIVMVAIFVYELSSYQLRLQLAKERNLLAFKAMHDPLTGLANRAEFSLRLQIAINEAKHAKTPFAVVYMDLDGFKPINDSLGHQAGDVVLQQVAARLKSVVRGTDLTARLGGDEFAMLLQGMNSETMIEPVLQKILRTVSQGVNLGKLGTVSVQTSIGVVFYRDEWDDPELLCRYADAAMYKAKEVKNTWSIYKDPIDAEIERNKNA